MLCQFDYKEDNFKTINRYQTCKTSINTTPKPRKVHQSHMTTSKVKILLISLLFMSTYHRVYLSMKGSTLAHMGYVIST